MPWSRLLWLLPILQRLCDPCHHTGTSPAGIQFHFQLLKLPVPNRHQDRIHWKTQSDNRQFLALAPCRAYLDFAEYILLVLDLPLAAPLHNPRSRLPQGQD